MSIYVIDFENTHENGLNGCEYTLPEDKVILFYSENAKSISLDCHQKMLTMQATVEYIKTSRCGKNFMDFQISTYVGALIHDTSVDQIIIVSKDNGYDAVIDFWKDRGYEKIRKQKDILGDKLNTIETPLEVELYEIHPEEHTIEEQSFQIVMNEQQEQPSSVPDEQETVQTVEEETFEKPNEEESNEEESKEEESKEQALQEETPSQTSVAKQDNMEATLPERYKKKVRTGMQGFGVKGPNYRSIYKAFLQATNHVQFRRYICESFPKDGDKIYAKIQNIFGEYRKECK